MKITLLMVVSRARRIMLTLLWVDHFYSPLTEDSDIARPTSPIVLDISLDGHRVGDHGGRHLR